MFIITSEDGHKVLSADKAFIQLDDDCKLDRVTWFNTKRTANKFVLQNELKAEIVDARVYNFDF